MVSIGLKATHSTNPLPTMRNAERATRPCDARSGRGRRAEPSASRRRSPCPQQSQRGRHTRLQTTLHGRRKPLRRLGRPPGEEGFLVVARGRRRPRSLCEWPPQTHRRHTRPARSAAGRKQRREHPEARRAQRTKRHPQGKLCAAMHVGGCAGKQRVCAPATLRPEELREVPGWSALALQVVDASSPTIVRGHHSAVPEDD